MFAWLRSLFASPNITCVRDPLDDGKEDSAYPTEFAAMMGRIRSKKTDWHQDWLDTQGFLHNDDDLFFIDEPTEPESCDYCGGAGESRVTFRDPDDRPSVKRTAVCKSCGGKGYQSK